MSLMCNNPGVVLCFGVSVPFTYVRLCSRVPVVSVKAVLLGSPVLKMAADHALVLFHHATLFVYSYFYTLLLIHSPIYGDRR